MITFKTNHPHEMWYLIIHQIWQESRKLEYTGIPHRSSPSLNEWHHSFFGWCHLFLTPKNGLGPVHETWSLAHKGCMGYGRSKVEAREGLHSEVHCFLHRRNANLNQHWENFMAHTIGWWNIELDWFVFTYSFKVEWICGTFWHIWAATCD